MQLKAVHKANHQFGWRANRDTSASAFEVRIVRAHIDELLLAAGMDDHIDPDAWCPLIMSFCQFYGLGDRAGVSRLAEIPKRMYRPAPAIER